MALKDNWRDLVDTTNGMDGDDASAEDINKIAHAVIDNEEKIKTLDEKIGDVDLSGKEDIANKVDYFDESVLSYPNTEEYPTTYAAMSAIVEQAKALDIGFEQKLEDKEDVANKISEWQDEYSGNEYPTAQLVKSGIDTAMGMAEDGITQASGAYLLADQALTEALAAGDAAETALEGVDGKEDTANKVTSISSSSTDEQYPSAKAVFDGIQNKTGWELVKYKITDRKENEPEYKEAKVELAYDATQIEMTLQTKYKELFWRLIIPTQNPKNANTSFSKARTYLYVNGSNPVAADQAFAMADGGNDWYLRFHLQNIGNFCSVEKFWFPRVDRVDESGYIQTTSSSTTYLGLQPGKDIGAYGIEAIKLLILSETSGVRYFPAGTYYEIWGIKA